MKRKESRACRQVSSGVGWIGNEAATRVSGRLETVFVYGEETDVDGLKGAASGMVGYVVIDSIGDGEPAEVMKKIRHVHGFVGVGVVVVDDDVCFFFDRIVHLVCV